MVVVHVKRLINNIGELFILPYLTKAVVGNCALLPELVVETRKVHLCPNIALLNINFHPCRAIAVTDKVFVGIHSSERLREENASHRSSLQLTLVLLSSVEDSEHSPQYILASCASQQPHLTSNKLEVVVADAVVLLA
jgi:hypothetical protein